MCTAATPAASGANASSSLGIDPPLHDPIVDGGPRLGDRQPRDQAGGIVLVAPDAADRGAGDQRRRARARRELAGDHVGVDVQRHAAGVRSQAGDHGEVAAGIEDVEQRAVDPLDVADQTEVDRLAARSRDDARGATMRADDAARPGEADRRDTRRAQRRDQIDVEPPGHHHLHDVERCLVRDAPPADQLRLDAEAARQLRRLRSAPVHDDQAKPRGARARDLPGGDGQRRQRQDVAAELDDRQLGIAAYGHGPGSSSEAVSASPSMRFMFWIACPAPPLIRLSVALTTASVREAPAGVPSVKPDLGVVAAGDGRHLGQPVAHEADEGLAGRRHRRRASPRQLHRSRPAAPRSWSPGSRATAAPRPGRTAARAGARRPRPASPGSRACAGARAPCRS